MAYADFIIKFPMFGGVEEATYNAWLIDAIAIVAADRIPEPLKSRAIDLKLACLLSGIVRTETAVNKFTLREDGYSVEYGNGGESENGFCIAYDTLARSYNPARNSRVLYADRGSIDEIGTIHCGCADRSFDTI